MTSPLSRSAEAGGLQSPWERRLPACAKVAEWSFRPAQVGCLRAHWQARSLRSQEKSDFAILLSAEVRTRASTSFVFLRSRSRKTEHVKKPQVSAEYRLHLRFFESLSQSRLRLW